MGQGAATALPVWANYMQKVYNDATLGYVQSDSFDIKADSLQLNDESLPEFDFATSSQTQPSTSSTSEDDDVESYFD